MQRQSQELEKHKLADVFKQQQATHNQNIDMKDEDHERIL